MPTRDRWAHLKAPSAPYEKSKSLGSGGSMVARLKLKEIDGRAPPMTSDRTQGAHSPHHYIPIAIALLSRFPSMKKQMPLAPTYSPNPHATCTTKP